MGVGASSTSKGVNTATCLIAQHYSVCTEQFTVYKCTSVEMAISIKEAPTISTIQRSPLCVVCGQAIVLQHNRFRCNEPDKSKLTKLGDILENVAKRADIQFKLTMGAVSHMCRHCREFILRLDKLYQNVLTLQSKLRLQLKQGSVHYLQIESSTTLQMPQALSKSLPRDHLKIRDIEASLLQGRTMILQSKGQ